MVLLEAGKQLLARTADIPEKKRFSQTSETRKRSEVVRDDAASMFFN
jgi:hypothetical protein